MRTIITRLGTALLLLTAACQKAEDEPEKLSPGFGTANVFMLSFVDTAEFKYLGQVFSTNTGRKFKFTTANLYMSHFTLRRNDGYVHEFSGVHHLKTIGNISFDLGRIPVGKYVAFSFSVGVDPEFNTLDPGIWKPADPLGPQNPSMWFGSKDKGYIFVNVEGKVDTSGEGNLDSGLPFSVHIGSLPLVRRVTLPEGVFFVSANQSQTLNVACDFGRLFEGVPLDTSVTTDTWEVRPQMAARLADNIPGMFRYFQP